MFHEKSSTEPETLCTRSSGTRQRDTGLRRIARAFLVLEQLSKSRLAQGPAVSRPAQRLAVEVARRSDARGACRVPLATLGGGKSPEQTRLALGELERAKLVVVHRTPGAVHTIQLRLRGDDVLAAEHALQSCPSCVALIRAVINDLPKSDAEAMALLVLAFASDVNGIASDSNAALAALLRCTQRHLRRIIEALVAGGRVKRVGRLLQVCSAQLKRDAIGTIHALDADIFPQGTPPENVRPAVYREHARASSSLRATEETQRFEPSAYQRAGSLAARAVPASGNLGAGRTSPSTTTPAAKTTRWNGWLQRPQRIAPETTARDVIAVGIQRNARWVGHTASPNYPLAGKLAPRATPTRVEQPTAQPDASLDAMLREWAILDYDDRRQRNATPTPSSPWLEPLDQQAKPPVTRLPSAPHATAGGQR